MPASSSMTAPSETQQKLLAYYQNPLVQAIVLASTVASTYHGYKRNDSIGWALWWGLMGSMFPVVTPTIAYAQGFGEKKKK